MAIQTEKELQTSILKRLEELGYPSDVIIPDYKQGNIRMDIIVLDDESNLPIMLIECMRTNDRGALARKVETLRGFTRYFECPLKTYRLQTHSRLQSPTLLTLSSPARMNSSSTV